MTGGPSLSSLTTLRVGGPVGSLVEATTEAELLEAIRSADSSGAGLLVLGGGSNVLASDDGFPGVVVRDTRSSITVADEPACGGVSVTVAAGTSWDALVDRAVSEGWVGIEALSGIPGSVGATPVQNVGAYGQEVSQTIAQARTWDRSDGSLRTFAVAQCDFGYRDSVFKQSLGGGPTPRFVVLDVTFQLRQGDLCAPLAYAGLADALGVEGGARLPLAEVRSAVLGLRQSKGMVLDESDHDTWSAGSFFTNPIVGDDVAAALPEQAPRYPAEAGVKLSAAWLIEHAGFARGFSLPGSPAALSTKHTLALTNRGGATAADIVALARHVRAGVEEASGVTLVPEPVLVGLKL